MTRPSTHARPLSPHLGIYRFGPHMIASIVHRVTGDTLATLGALMLLGWLGAIAAGAAAYAKFTDLAWSLPGKVVLVGLTWIFFQHLFSGLRHLYLDTGAGYELKTNRAMAIATFVLSVIATALLWGMIMMDGLNG